MEAEAEVAAAAAAAAAAAEEQRRRDKIVYSAQLWEMMDRFEDMLGAMFSIAQFGNGYSELEKKLFSTAFHKVVEQKCSAWTIAARYQLKEKSEGNQLGEKASEDMRLMLEGEIKTTCRTIAERIVTQIIPAAPNASALIYFHEMTADCYCTIVEITEKSLEFLKGEYLSMAAVTLRFERREAVEQLLNAQELAMNVAKEQLTATSSIRLRTALKTATVFCEHGLNDRVYRLVKESYDEASSALKAAGAWMQVRDLMASLKHRLTLMRSKNDDAGNVGGFVWQLHESSGRPEDVKVIREETDLNDEEYHEDTRNTPVTSDMSGQKLQ